MSSSGKYSHLYKSSIYIPPSIERKMNIDTPNSNVVYGDLPNINKSSSINAISGINSMNRFLKYELSNKELYSSMKNKIMYSTSQDVSEHMRFNKL